MPSEGKLEDLGGEQEGSGEHCRPLPWENTKAASEMASTFHKAWFTAPSPPFPEKLTTSCFKQPSFLLSLVEV